VGKDNSFLTQHVSVNSARHMVGLDDLRGVLQPMILWFASQSVLWSLLLLLCVRLWRAMFSNQPARLRSVVALYFCCSGCFQRQKMGHTRGLRCCSGWYSSLQRVSEALCDYSLWFVMVPRMHGGWLWRVGGQKPFTAGFKFWTTCIWASRSNQLPCWTALC